jgi:hypothetical protein
MNIDSVLKKWDEAKKRKAESEKECEMYKEAVERYMKKKEKNKIEGTYYTVQKRSITRENLTKAMIPAEIWSRYSSSFSYMSYYLTKNK